MRFFVSTNLVCYVSIIYVLAGLALSEPVTNVDVRATWVAPTMNQDGTTYDDAAGFKLYYHKDGDAANEQSIDLPDPTLTEHLFQLSPGDWLFTITAYDMDDNESVRSNSVRLVIPSTIDTEPPSSPSSFACEATIRLQAGISINMSCADVAQ